MPPGAFKTSVILCVFAKIAGPTKLEKLRDCAFTSGIATRPDGRVDLYSGLCDCEEGRITIDDPFSAHGGAVERTLDGQV